MKKLFQTRQFFAILLLLVFLSPIFFSCETREKEALQTQVDSLKTELERSYQMSQTLGEVGVLLDSIDASRQVLRVNLEHGTPYEEYTERLRDVNDYIKTTHQKIDRLEQNLRTSSAGARSLARTIKLLKAELEKKGQDITFLQEQVEEEFIARRALELFDVIGEEGVGLYMIDKKIPDIEYKPD